MASAKAIGLTVSSPCGTKPAKTENMIVAAATTTGAAWRKPVTIASRGAGAVRVRLVHPGHQEDLVVHGQTEQDADDDDRRQAHQRAGGVDVDRLGEPAPLEDRDGRTERGADSEQEAEHADDRHQDRPEDQHQQHERQADDERQVDRQGGVQLLRHVDADRGVRR